MGVEGPCVPSVLALGMFLGAGDVGPDPSDQLAIGVQAPPAVSCAVGEPGCCVAGRHLFHEPAQPSQRALTAMVKSGMARDDAYRVVQENAQRAWDTGTEFRDLLAEAAPDLDLDAVFDYDAYLTHVPEVIERLETLRG